MAFILQKPDLLVNPLYPNCPAQGEHSRQRAQFAVLYPLIREKMAARGHDWFFDISNALDGDDYLLIDDVHVTTKGNALIAALIRQSLE